MTESRLQAEQSINSSKKAKVAHAYSILFLMHKYTNWTLPENEDELREAVANSKTIADVLKHFELVRAGGNYANIKHHISRLDLDISHFVGQGWKKQMYKTRDWANNKSAKEHLIRKEGHKCSNCKRKKWNSLPIPLELEHCDGNKYNFTEENLKLLCCNCHAQTKSWRRQKSLNKAG